MDNNLVEDIYNFCLDYGVIVNKARIKQQLESGLERAEFLEDLINTIFKTAKSTPNFDVKRVKELLIELEKVRLDLEFQEYTTNDDIGQQIKAKCLTN